MQATAKLQNPYVGARSFRKGEQLYGRELEVMDLLDLLIAERIVLMFSPSGAGKTSLIEARLIPELEKTRFKVLPTIRVNQEPPADYEQYGERFNRYTFSALVSLERNQSDEQRVPLIELATMTLSEYLTRTASNESRESRVLIFDQFEEVLTVSVADKAAKHAFFSQLGDALSDRRVWALFSVREDYVGSFHPYLRHIPNRLRRTFRLDLLEVDVARLAIQEPARKAGVGFSDEAASMLIDDLRKVQVQLSDGTIDKELGPYIEPVQLQVVCLRLWNSWKAAREAEQDGLAITKKDVERLGNIDNALADYYSDAVADVARHYSKENNDGAIKSEIIERAIRRWFDGKLITKDGIRAQVLQEDRESEGLDNEIIRLLVDTHLVRAEPRGRRIWFELAHDRLIQPVRNNNKEWFEANLSVLQRRAEVWDQEKRSDALLLRDKELKEGEEWAAKNALTPIEKEFLKESREGQDRRERDRRRVRYIRGLAVVSLILVVVSGVMYLRAETQRRKAVEAAETAKLAEEAAEAAKVAAVEQQAAAKAAECKATDAKFKAEGAQIQAEIHKKRAQEQFEKAEAERIKAEAEAEKNFRLAYAADVQLARQSYESNLLAAGRQALDPYRPGDKDDKEPGFEWYHLWRVLNRELAHWPADQLRVQAVAISPDGKTLATGGPDGLKWYTKSPEATDRPYRYAISVNLDESDVRSLAFLPDGKLLATRATTVKLWNGSSFVEIQSPHQKTLPHREVGPSTPLFRDDFSIALSPDGKKGAIGWSDGTIEVFDVESAKVVRTLHGHNGRRVHTLRFYPDGSNLISIGFDGFMRFWDTQAYNEYDQEKQPLHEDYRFLGASPDCKVWVFADNKNDRLMFFRSRPAKTGEAHGLEVPDFLVPEAIDYWHKPVTVVAFSPDGSILATGCEDDDTIYLLRSKTGIHQRIYEPIATLKGHNSGIVSLAFSSDGNMLASGDDFGTARLWSIAKLEQTTLKYFDQDGSPSVLFSPAGDALAAMNAKGVVSLFRSEPPFNRVAPSVGNTPDESVTSFAYLPNGDIVTAGKDGAAVWDAQTRQVKRRFELSPPTSRIVAASPDGAVLAVSDDRVIRLWDTSSWRPMKQLNPQMKIDFLAFSPKNHALAVAQLGTIEDGIKLIDYKTGSVKATFPEIRSINTAALSPDGKMMAIVSHSSPSVDDTTVELWDITTNEVFTVARDLGSNEQFFVNTVAFSPNSRTLAAGGAGDVRLWDVKTRRPLLTLNTATSGSSRFNVESLAFSRDGLVLATGLSDGTIRVWLGSTKAEALKKPGENPNQ